jgi:YggT family protein
MGMIATLIDVYVLIVVAAVVVSWMRLDPKHPAVSLLVRLTEPALAPIRRVVPPVGGLDLSPLVLVIALQLVKRLLS